MNTLELKNITINTFKGNEFEIIAHAGDWGMCDKNGNTMYTRYCVAFDLYMMLCNVVEWQSECAKHWTFGFYNFNPVTMNWYKAE